METINHNGDVYTKATILAKKYRYTTDYIGQLCRQNKVDAKLVGRAWFVNEDSLTHHKSERYATTRSAEVLSQNSHVSSVISANRVSRQDVFPRLSKVTHRLSVHTSTKSSIPANHKPASSRVLYSSDSNDLLPATIPLKNKITPKFSNLPVELVDQAKKKLVFEDIATVSLRGDLHIDSLDDPDLFSDTEPVSVEDLLNVTEESVEKESEFLALESNPVRVTRRYQPVEAVIHKDYASRRVDVPVDLASIPREVAPSLHSFKPSGIHDRYHSFSYEFPLLLLLIGLSVLGLFATFGLSGFVESEGSYFNQSVNFSWPDMSEIAELFLKEL
jgi:hypothetical protein